MHCCLSRLLEGRAKTGCWRISALKCAGGKLVGLVTRILGVGGEECVLRELNQLHVTTLQRLDKTVANKIRVKMSEVLRRAKPAKPNLSKEELPSNGTAPSISSPRTRATL